jgi:Flp pilus assembly protein TadG
MKKRAQTIIEFTAGMVVLCLMMYGMVEVFRWGMVDMAERRFDHEQSLLAGSTAEQQLNPNFHAPRPMDTLWYKKQN